MKELDNSYSRKNGFSQVQIAISDYAYVYEMDVSGVKYYNVFKRKENTRFNTVSFPSNENFGRWAWCYKQREDAFKRFNEINESSHRL